MNTLALLTAMNDAAMVFTSLSPLYQRVVGGGAAVTPEEAEAALAAARVRLLRSMDDLDEAIAAAKQQSGAV